MSKTLHWYISRDLLRIWLLASIGLTIMLTIFSVIEPLRKQQGMSIGQVMSFLGYMIPFMLSLTLPISALFAATITYGRFSQDNELLACRASGISTMSLLRPALILGVFVTAMSLVLSNYVAPEMMRRSFAALNANPKSLMYRQLENKNYFKQGEDFVHADAVDEDKDQLQGLVYASWGPLRSVIEQGDKVRIKGDPKRTVVKVHQVNSDNTYDLRMTDESILPRIARKQLDPLPKERDVKLMIASQATVRISGQASEDPVIDIDFTNVNATRSRDGAGNMLTESQHRGLRFDVPNPLKDKAAWLSWDELLDTIARPVQNKSVMRELDKIRLDLRHDCFIRDLTRGIREHKEYRSLSGTTVMSPSQPAVERQFIINADTIEETPGRRPKQSLGARLTNTDKKTPVRMQILENGQLRQTISSMPGAEIVVGVEYDKFTDGSQVYVSMPGQVDVRTVGDPQVQRRADFTVGQLAIPADLEKEVTGLKNENIYSGKGPGGGDITSRASIIKATEGVRDDFATKLQREVVGEINSRLAYSASCLLMVLLGSALGLIFRGGQFITAFAIAAVPGSMVIIALLMGKGIMQNIKVNELYGLVAIWGGIALLTVATTWVYIHLARK